MKKYNFDKLKDRRNTGSLKWNSKENELPMWVADMDFETIPEVKEAIKKTAELGIFGYSDLSDDYFKCYSDFILRHHNFYVDPKNMVYSNGIVAAISSMVRKLTTPGEKVLVIEPTYNIFYNSIVNNGRFIETSSLIKDDNLNYSIDFNDLENKMKDNQVSLMILCNPINPVGKLLSKEELVKIAELAKKYHLLVISDEIHSDIVIPGKEYVPFLSVSETAKEIGIACISMSKTFNIAGIQTACIYTFNESLRYKIWRGINTDEVGEPNIFGEEVNKACLKYGDEYIKELNEYIYENKKVFVDLINNSNLKIKTYLSDATYLLWIDCTKYNLDSSFLVKDIREKVGLILSSGATYGKTGNGFLRINLGTSKENVIKGANLLIKYFKELEN